MANRQYLTPPDMPDDVYCRVLRIPNSAQWIGTLTGVLYPLCFASAWTDEDGGITPEQAAERFTQLFNEYLESDGICDMGMFDVRQSEVNPCVLEKTEDGGLVWQPFAMLDLCAALQPRPDTKLPSLIRYNDDTDAIEYSLDGGETWVEAIPPATPETNPWTPPRIPAEGSTDDLKRCNAANRAVGNLNDMYRQTYGAIVAGIANTLTDFSKFVAELADVVFGVVYGYWYTIPDLLLDYWFGPEVYNYYTAPELPLTAQEDLLCLLYQYASVSGDGVVSFDFGAVRDNVIDVLGINPGIAVWSHLNYLSEAGLNRLGDIGFGAGLSCDDCGPCTPLEPEVAVPARGSTPAPYSWIGFEGSQAAPAACIDPEGTAWFSTNNILELVIGDGGRCHGLAQLVHYRQGSVSTPPTTDSMECSVNYGPWQPATFVGSPYPCNAHYDLAWSHTVVTSIRWRFTSGQICYVNEVVLK